MYKVKFMIDGMQDAILKADTDYSLGHLIAAVIGGSDRNAVEIWVQEDDDQGGAE